MKTIIFLLLSAVLLLHGYAFSADSGDIKYIRDTYKKISDSAASGIIYVTKYDAKHHVVPMIGIPEMRGIFYYDSLPAHTEREENRFFILKAEYYIQMGTFMQYEEYLYEKDGTVLFYHRKEGNGSLSKLAAISWKNEERYYFKGDKLIRATIGGKEDNAPGKKYSARSKDVLMHGKSMKELGRNISLFPLQSFSE